MTEEEYRQACIGAGKAADPEGFWNKPERVLEPRNRMLVLGVRPYSALPDTWILTEGNGFIYSREIWQRVRAMIDKFYTTYTDESIDEYNWENLGEMILKDREARKRKPAIEPEPPKPHKDEAPGCVYLMRADNGAYKIGLSRRPRERVQQLRRNRFGTIEVLHVIETDNMRALERELHKRYADKQIHGEWFMLDESDVAEIKAL
jgi:hypothetical protein